MMRETEADEGTEEAWSNERADITTRGDDSASVATEEDEGEEEDEEEALRQIVRETIANTPPRQRGERAEWKQRVGWGRREEVGSLASRGGSHRGREHTH